MKNTNTASDISRFPAETNPAPLLTEVIQESAADASAFEAGTIKRLAKN
jgi:hypothetical protein